MYLKVIGRALRPGIPPHNIVQFNKLKLSLIRNRYRLFRNQYPLLQKLSKWTQPICLKGQAQLHYRIVSLTIKELVYHRTTPYVIPNEPNQIRKPRTKPPDIQDDPKKFFLPEGKNKLG